MGAEHITPAEYLFIRGFFIESMAWTQRNQTPINKLIAKARNNVDYFTSHPEVKPDADDLLLAVFLVCIGCMAEHYEEVLRCMAAIDSRARVEWAPITPADAREQVQSLLAKIKSEL